jgi:hypothetical protein
MTTETNGTHTTTELEGRVSRVNERGVLLDGRSDWLNVSKFAGGIWLPDAGDRVRLTLDSAGFIRKIAPLEQAAAAPVDTHPAPQVSTPAQPPAVDVGGDRGPVDRDRRILRQAVLNTATAILTSGGRQTEVSAVLAAAEVLEQWVLR